jgi:uncharacterized NAD-dependent epimerase/dehydratase family protein
MFKIRKDIGKNRLYVTLSGIFPVSEAKNAKDDILREVGKLKPNFDVINDISEFIRGQEEGGIILQEIMHILIEKKVNRIARVIGTSKTGLLQFANYSLQIDSYKVKYLPTIEEAEKFLDEDSSKE